METTHEKLQKLMNSYVPEFAYQQHGNDPGSVMTDLCASMIEECEKRYEQVIPKHQIQYLNLFDAMLKEPVSASKGYVQFQVVNGYEGMVSIPRKTQVLAESEDVGTIVFETEHSITVTDTKPVMWAVTDQKEDKIVVSPYDNKTEFTAFSVVGENCSKHCLYLCFDELFDWVEGLDLFLLIRSASESAQEELLEMLSSSHVHWSMLEPEGKEHIFSEAEIIDGYLHLHLENYIPQKTIQGQKEGYYLVLTCDDGMPDIYLNTLAAVFEKKDWQPEKVYVNQVQETARSFYPFGKPLSLYREFSFDDKEVLSRKGAKIQMKFQLTYQNHEEVIEMPEMETEYKAIMKKPQKALSVRPVEVLADYVCWEYLSKTGWKRLFKEEHINVMFNGSVEGEVNLDFICPNDIVDYDEGLTSGRIRARLLQAENIYRMPAIYRCPVISALRLSYSYMEVPQYPDYALIKNNFEEKNITQSLRMGGNVHLFHHTEHGKRTMYLGFQGPISGLPFSLYFDIENYSDRAVQFQVEYLSEKGFVPVRVVDTTGGFCGSGTMLLMIPEDMKKTTLFGTEGYFLRFLNYNQENPEYALPIIKGIYPNMARVANVHSVVEEFYLDNMEDMVDIQLSQQNLLKASVKVHEQTKEGKSRWVPWKKAERVYDGGRTYQIDMASGILHFRKNTFVHFELPEEGPHIHVEYSNYTGSKANLPSNSIKVLGNAIRYISSVTNPFPTFGGYDGYTEEKTKRLVTGMLRTRNRAVCNRDFFDIISQVSYGIRKVKCCHHTDAEGKKKIACVTIAVLIEEYEKGAHVFSEIKKSIRDRLIRDSALFSMGRELYLIQPRFLKLNVSVWLEKDSMEYAYELQQKAKTFIWKFIDPLTGGLGGSGWEIGELPRQEQLLACLRTNLSDCNISKIVMTVLIHGKEVPLTDEFYEKESNPFFMAVNGEHRVYIEVMEC